MSRPDVRLLTLAGFGGMGKSRVALRLAERCVEEKEDWDGLEDATAFPGGVWWVALEEVDRTGDDLLRRVAQALCLPPQPGLTVGEQVASHLREGGDCSCWTTWSRWRRPRTSSATCSPTPPA